ncbi:MAG: hypothetical protein IH845_02020 [Nanoarchaeota archaeon]|nr:hypothetical protein [Nanoarchaeota archaeon]
MKNKQRKDTAVRVSRWVDEEVEIFINNETDKRIKVEFPSKRNFVDKAVIQLLEERGVNLSK